MARRLDIELTAKGLVSSRSQAESIIHLGQVKVNGRIVLKPGTIIKPIDKITLSSTDQYVSRAGLKLASVAKQLELNFKDKIVLDVGSSTGGFTDYALKQGAKKVIAVDVGTNQLHSSLHGDKRIELHEKTDVRDFQTTQQIDIILIDVSFISLTKVLLSIHKIAGPNTIIAAMAKPQFEAGDRVKHKGVIKNEKLRREVLLHLENWIKNLFIVLDKADSKVAGAQGNLERFYKLKAYK
jgi:23S rRNA (cytidine1920-2'-O)/16S rRNA (cytidine1409-2'-O)-methyltransferase